MAADHIGRTQAQLWSGSSGKVQPPTRYEVGTGDRAGSAEPEQSSIGRAVRRVAPEHLPRECRATVTRNSLMGCDIQVAHDGSAKFVNLQPGEHRGDPRPAAPQRVDRRRMIGNVITKDDRKRLRFEIAELGTGPSPVGERS